MEMACKCHLLKGSQAFILPAVGDEKRPSGHVLVMVYCTYVGPILDFACEVFHYSIPAYLNQIKQAKKRALRIIFFSLPTAKRHYPSTFHRFKTPFVDDFFTKFLIQDTS